MSDKTNVFNSFKKEIRQDKPSKYDHIVIESTFIINRCKKIKTIFLSKQLCVFLRNFNKKEIEFCLPIVSKEIEEFMKVGYDKISKYELLFNTKESEMYNLQSFFKSGIANDFHKMSNAINYIYFKQMYSYKRLDKMVSFSNIEDFESIPKTAKKIAKKICSQFIVLEVVDYKKLYNILNKYYSLKNDISIMNHFANRFIFNFIKLINIVCLENDSHISEENQNFRIFKFEDFKFKINEYTEFYDGYFHNLYDDKNISKDLFKINSNYIDAYIKNNKENLNNLLFIVSRLDIEDDRRFNFNYREYNLNLISILELLLIDSKSENDIQNKFVKNILICASIVPLNFNYDEEKLILNAIYRYRSCILHGNQSGYKNAVSDLEKRLNYKPPFLSIPSMKL